MGETFTILDDGETLITGEWVPSPDDLSARMIALAGAYDNMLPALVASRQAAIDSTEAHFDSQSSPDGVPWQKLDPFYLNSKVAAGFPSDEILVRTGAGKAAVLDETNWFINEDALWFSPITVPEYMNYHQTGTGSGTGETVVSQLEKGKKPKGSGNRGLNLPQREFLGFGEIDTLVFEDIWNQWFGEQLLEEFPTNIGGGAVITERTGFNMLGEFPIIGHTKRGQPILRTPRGVRFGRY